jgi:hypothetical protein
MPLFQFFVKKYFIEVGKSALLKGAMELQRGALSQGFFRRQTAQIIRKNYQFYSNILIVIISIKCK